MLYSTSTVSNRSNLVLYRGLVAFVLCFTLFTSSIAGAVMVVSVNFDSEESASSHHQSSSVHTSEHSMHDMQEHHHKDCTGCEHGECDCASSHIACTVHCAIGVPTIASVNISPLYMSIGSFTESNVLILNRNPNALFKPPRV